MTSGSLKVDARSIMTLFQPQPSGLPSMDQMKSAFFSFAARFWASSSETFQGMSRHSSTGGGFSDSCSFLQSESERPWGAHRSPASSKAIILFSSGTDVHPLRGGAPYNRASSAALLP